MDKLAGPEKPYVKELELAEAHENLYVKSLDIFDEIATMGAQSTIIKTKGLPYVLLIV